MGGDTCIWKGTHRSGIALASGHGSQTSVVLYLRAEGLGEGDGMVWYGSV